MEDIYITFIWKNLFLIMSSIVGVLITIIGWLWFKVDDKINESNDNILDIKEKINEMYIKYDDINNILMEQQKDIELSVANCEKHTESIKKITNALYKFETKK